jgi:hypothetical protein
MRDVGLVTRGAATRSPCLRGELRDRDVATAGVQPACRVETVDAAGGRVELPSCDRAEGRDCFTLAVDPACAETETQLAVQVAERSDDKTLTVACEVAE